MYGFLPLQFKQGKVGPDGKELIPHESPTVNGYGFEATPSPAPGMNSQCSWNMLSFLFVSTMLQGLLRINICIRIS